MAKRKRKGIPDPGPISTAEERARLTAPTIKLGKQPDRGPISTAEERAEKTAEPIQLETKKEGVISKVKDFFDKFSLEKVVKKQTGEDIDVRAGFAPGITPVGSIATVSASVHAHKLITTKVGAEKLVGIGTRTATRSFVGQPAKSGVDKIFNIPVRNVATRYATNTKSAGLTTKILIGAGLSLGAVSIARDVIGTYPFAAFGKEEALQVTNFPISRLIDEGLYDKAEELLNMSNEIINLTPSVIPYKNVLQEFNKYVDAQALANEGWEALINKKKDEETEEDKWVRIFKEQEDRRIEQREADQKYYEGVQESMERARAEQRAEDEIYWNNINEENIKREEQKRKEDEAYYAALRENIDDWNTGTSQLNFGLFN